MNKGLLKNILIVLFLTMTVFSIFKYKSVLNEKYELLNTLGQTRDQVAALEKAKQNLLQDIDKRKESEQAFKENLRASKIKLTKLFVENNQTKQALDELSSETSSLKTENDTLKKQKEQISRENENLKAKLSSIEQLKMTIQELMAHENQAEEGNKGFLIKNSQSTYPAKVRIEVVPASPKE
jgi:chromosome segregation ATPase